MLGHKAFLALVLSSLSLTSVPAHAALQGKLWLVSSTNLMATFPAPTATPDATFVPKHFSFYMNAPGSSQDTNAPNLNNSVSGFLNSADKVGVLAFSGLTNPAVGGVVQATTPIINTTSGGCGTTTYGVYMEITGKVKFTANELVTVTHDDGVSLKIDGTLVSGIHSGPNNPQADVFVFTGTTGSHVVDMVYANSCAGGLLSFSPNM
jgi:hypothetical protein